MTAEKDPVAILKAGVFTENPLLIRAVGLAPVLAGVSTFYAGVLLSAVSAAQLMLTAGLTAALFKKLPASLRAPAYLLTALPVTLAGMALGAVYLPEQTAQLGVFLPLTAVSSLTALHCERSLTEERGGWALGAFSSTIGYTLAVLAVSAVRELTVCGALCGFSLGAPPVAPAAQKPFFALLLMGFLAAGINALFKKDLRGGGAQRGFMAHSVLLRDDPAEAAQADAEENGRDAR